MKNGFVKVCAYSPDVKIADTDYNKKQIIEAMEKAKADEVKLLVLPELAITGYTLGDLFYQDVLLNSALSALEDIVKASKGLDMLVFVGMPLKHQSNIYNVAVAIFDGNILGVVPKTYLPNYNEFYEKRQFTPAEKDTINITLCNQVVPFGTKLIFADKEMKSFKVACEICEDIWVMNSPSTSHALAGATIIVNLSASNELIGKASFRRSMISQHSSKLIAGYVYTSAGMGESTAETVYAGHKIIAEDGYILAESKLFVEDNITSEIDVDSLEYERSKIADCIKDNPEYQVIEFNTKKTECKLSRRYSKTPFVPTKDNYNERCDLVLNIQAYALAKRIERSHSSTVVLGISGGLDSTLALVVAVRAMDILKRGKENVIGVTMPCFGTSNRTLHNAEHLMELLGITSMKIDIKQAVLQHFKDIGHENDAYDITYENCQARERTQILMDLANKHNGLVIGTGDLSESALGWCTYNGDHMSMYSVNCGVPKTLVAHLIKYQATISEGELKDILTDVANTDISPELLPPDSKGNIQQKTEDKVGPYILHDFFLFYLIRKGMAPSKVYRLANYVFDEFDGETIKKWLTVFIKRFFTQQFKRDCVPNGVKVGTVSLSPRADWRMPSDATATLWLKELEENI